ncbi:non-ribosomal peptide synthetase [Pseudoduganella flava]|uniref:non-ribosomal peptide synthetase n=1 Tax=Pseudoduganella flava TaxID=871742 RepID=UPI001303DCFA|nr:non-ribosomal peptide synthetase [Pseudoduganella flava]
MQALVRELNEQGVYPFLHEGRLKTRSRAGGSVAPALADKIRAHKDALIAFLGGDAGTAAPPIVPAAGAGTPAPLSYAQRRLWFIEQLQGGGGQYNMPTALELTGRVDLDAIEWALDAIVQRHAVLRTTYAAGDGEPYQQVRTATLRLGRTDLRGVPEPGREEALQCACAAEAAQPFDLAADLMLRAHVFTVAEDRHVLVVTLHHIACDGWSKGVLTREFAALYGARMAGTPAALAPLPVQYADYARWQATPAVTQRMTGQLAYWEERLAGAPPLHGLRLDRPRPPQQQIAAGAHLQQLDGALLARLKRVGLDHDATLFMVLHAAFAVLLARHGQERSVVIGSPVAGRQRHELEPLIGFFVNMLVLRTDVEPGQSFTALLARTRADALAAYANQDVPFEMLVERLQPERNLSHAPLFQILFALQNNDYGGLELPGAGVRAFGTGQDTGRFDLELLAGERDGGLTLNWVYASALFDAATIAALADSFAVLLAALCADPACPVGDLALLTADDRARLARWQAGATVAERAVPIHQLFERHAARSGGAVALVHGDTRLTFAQLNAQANRLAAALIGRGVGRDQLVGISLPRGPAMVAAVLAVLKAGAAYVAFDPDYPPARLERMLDDSAVPLVLTDAGAAWRTPHERGLALDVGALPAGLPDTDPGLPIDPEQLAYAIYTSGSTGKPKGIVLPHRVLANLLHDQYRRHPVLAQPLPALQYATLNFDMSIYEIMTALCNGGTLVLPPDDARTSLARLGELLRAERVGRAYLPTALLPEFCRHAVQQGLALPDLRMIQVAGEALTINADVRAFFRATPHCTLLNLYGPSETHVVTDVALAGDPDLWPVVPPIGWPVDHCTLRLLDERGNAVPRGVAGELFIGGACLARGYLNEPDMTAAKFVVLDGQRLYRSGDLVRHRPDGALEYLGRIGRQIKLHGFRIELDEIEHCLLADRRVADAVVLATGEGAERTLVAYLVLCDGAAAAALDDIGAGLAAAVPEYMVPPVFEVLERFPLNANGKVDVARLPAPRRAASAPYEAPAAGLERQVARLWAELLKKRVDEIGAHARFFELGGHSLLAMRLINRIEQECGIRAGVRTVFARPTLRALCTELAALPRAAARAMAGGAGPGPHPLSHAQQRLWYIDQLEGGSAQYHLPVALCLRGTLDVAALRVAFDTIVARHDVLRTVYANDDGQPVQRVLPVRAMPFAVVDATWASGPDDPALVERLRTAAAAPFDLARDGVLRAQLFALAPDTHVLLVTLHHIAGDGWSLGVLTRELAALYAGTPLPALPLQYADFATWQRDPEQRAQLDRQLAYWRDQLAGLPPVHGLPLDRPRPTRADYAGALHTQRLDAALTARIRALADAGGATLFMALQAAFAVVLMRWSHAAEFALGTPVAGRGHAGLDQSIGLFVNTLVLRHALADNATFRQQVDATRQLALDAFAHQDVPFELLVETLKPARSLAHAPLFQVSFALQNNEAVALELPGVDVAGVPLGAAQAKFDLSLSVRESGDELVLHWTYATSLFDGATVARLADSLQVFLGAALDAPDRPLLALPLAPAADLAALRAWNDTRDTSIALRCVHETIAETARRVPDAPAVRDAAGDVSYQALDAAADAIARRLAAHGVGPGDRVALCIEPSAELLAALLGVLRRGAAYLPLELRNGPARMDAILADAGAAAVLLGAGLADALPDVAACPHIAVDGCLGSGWDAGWDDSAAVPQPDVGLAASAYVVYTSGTTGVPKGVDVHHGGLADYCAYAGRRYYGPHLAGSLVVTSHGFDITVPALLLPLLHGGCVTLLPRGDVLPRAAAVLAAPDCPDYLLRMTPMHVQGLLALLGDGAPSPARHAFVIGGERFPAALARQLRQRFPASAIYNHYGPSETVVGCCMQLIGEQELDGATELPIGTPLPNTCLYVLNEAMRPTPRGAPGELYIGGAGVSNGYLNRPDLTARQFVANPFGPDWAPRLYRSGDLVRMDRAGRLVHLGRIDEQIKLRGFRIEPAEIEAHIARVAGVRKAVVVAAGESERRHLAAYLETDHATGADAEALVGRVRAALHGALPDYLVPAAYLCVERLPLSANGKLDRRALPPIVAPAAPPAAPPATPTEHALRDVWADLLGIDAETIDTTAGFFSLGGHSLLAVMLVEAVRRRFGVRLPLGSLYTAPDVRAQAALIDAGGGGEQPAVTLQAGSGAPLFLIHPVGGDLLCYRALVRELAYDGPVYGIEHAGFSGTGAIAVHTVDQLADAYCARLRQVQPDGPYRLAGWSLGGVIALAVAHRLEREGATVAYLGLVDSVLEHAPEPWGALQARVADVMDLEEWRALFDADPGLAAGFDRAYGLDVLAAGGPVRERLRSITLAGLVAGRLCRSVQPVRALHYYGAAATARHTGADAATRLLALGRDVADACWFDTDHFSLVQAPWVAQLAGAMRTHLSHLAPLQQQRGIPALAGAARP